MEQAGNVVVVSSFSSSVANVDIARLPEGSVGLVRSVDDSTVLGKSNRKLSLELFRDITDSMLSRV